MTDTTHAAPNFAKWRAGILAATLLAGGGGYYLGQRGDAPAMSATSADGRKVLYYYDPMFPQQKFDKPGKSPFMDMELEPKYADAGGAASGA
ncbi:MAG: efflux RND transporter periplasmic adaptor subunit, partial [Sphingopyxis sp.]|nr:efflux RND transporter periplasmic adaptor subunit [Sphingopyxis sp.]